jgi:hypothetical protein
MGERLSFIDRPLPPSFELRVVAVAPGHERSYDEAEWRGALVVVERGEIELECLAGNRLSCGVGSVLWLVGLPLRALHNHGPETAAVIGAEPPEDRGDRHRDC